MDTLVVVLALAVSVLFLGRRMLASWQSARASRDGCGSDCGCSSTAPARPDGWDQLR